MATRCNIQIVSRATLYIVCVCSTGFDNASLGVSCAWAARVVSHASPCLDVTRDAAVSRISLRQNTYSTTVEQNVTCQTQNLIVAGYRRRHVLVEEVPGLYIRRLTLEDPRIARERLDRSDSRSPSPVRHICHPRSAETRPGRGSSSSYRFWLERVRREKPACLTITSLELPDCPIPLVESQASARWRCAESLRSSEKDEILDEFIESISKAGRSRKNAKSADQRVSKVIRRSRRQFIDSAECQGTLCSLEACTKGISKGPPRAIIANSSESIKDCICSEITENLRINICEKTEVKQPSPRTPSPEVTHTIRIAMKYLGQSQRQPEDTIENDGARTPEDTPRDTKSEESREGNECSVNVALDFTLNCCSVQLTSRDITLKPTP